MSEHQEHDVVDEFMQRFLKEDAYVPYRDQGLPSKADKLAFEFFQRELHAGVHHQNEVLRRTERLPLKVFCERMARWGEKERSREHLRVGLTVAAMLAGRDHRGSPAVFQRYLEIAEATLDDPRQLFVDVACRVSPTAGETVRAFIYDDGERPPREDVRIDRSEESRAYDVSDAAVDLDEPYVPPSVD